jgi:phosphoglycerate dehydrogenase-like enzyme
MNVVAYDPYVSRGVEIAVGVDRVESLKDLLAMSDVVSLHRPLMETAMLYLREGKLRNLVNSPKRSRLRGAD